MGTVRGGCVFGGPESERRPEVLVLKGGGGGTVGGPEGEKSPELFDLVPDSELEDIEDSDDDDLFALALDTNNKRKLTAYVLNQIMFLL